MFKLADVLIVQNAGVVDVKAKNRMNIVSEFTNSLARNYFSCFLLGYSFAGASIQDVPAHIVQVEIEVAIHGTLCSRSSVLDVLYFMIYASRVSHFLQRSSCAECPCILRSIPQDKENSHTKIFALRSIILVNGYERIMLYQDQKIYISG